MKLRLGKKELVPPVTGAREREQQSAQLKETYG